MAITMRPFQRADNRVIARWFDDPASRRWLESPWSDDELELMAQEANGREYVAIAGDGRIVGAIGCYLPLPSNPCHVLSAVHVDPGLRRRGIAAAMLGWLLEAHATGQQWQTLVEPANAPMTRLLAGAGWKRASGPPDAHGFLTYVRNT